MDSANYPRSTNQVASSHPNLKFRKTQRVLSGMRFRKIIYKGRCKSDHLLVLFAIPTKSDSQPKIGITIPKKTGNAVIRNRWKRLLREAFRTQQHRFPSGFDYVVRPKKGTTANSADIHRSLLKLAQIVTVKSK